MTDVTTGAIRCVGDILRVHGTSLADRTAVQCAGQSLTFAEFYSRAKSVAGALVDRGVGAQDRVAVIDRNSVENLEVVFGAALLNAVVVNVNWRLAPPEILQILADAQTRLVIVGSEFFGAVEAIEEQMADEVAFVAIGDHPRWDAYGPWVAGSEPVDPGTVAARNMAGYWNNVAATQTALDEDGWLRTGDAGYLDEDGFVYLHDRVKDMIVSGGENVYPAEVENALMRHPGVADVAVFGVPDARWGEAVKAAVVPTDPADPPSAEDLISFSRDHLAGYKCPNSIDCVTALPRNPSGKLLKRELRAPYWEGAGRQIG